MKGKARPEGSSRPLPVWLKQTAGEIAREQAEAQRRADATAGKTEQAASASQCKSKSEPEGQQHVPTKAATAETKGSILGAKGTVDGKLEKAHLQA